MGQARADLALAAIPLPQGAAYEGLCFHAQQAAEKALKAVYVHYQWIFEYVHDIAELILGLQKNGLVIPQEVSAAVPLSRYAFQTRYPGLTEPITEVDHEKAVKLAAAVVRWAEAITGK
jgi:HEPN domain-containing protein